MTQNPAGLGQVPLSTLLTASLSVQRVTADSKAAQVPARLVVVMQAEVPLALVGVPEVVAAEEDSMAVVAEGGNRLLKNGGNNSV